MSSDLSSGADVKSLFSVPVDLSQFAAPRTHLFNKEIWHLPRSKVAASLRLVPIHNVRVVSFAPFLRSITIVASKPTHTNRKINRPCGCVRLALPIVTSRGRCRVGKPIQHDCVEHLIFAEHRLHLSVVVRPVFEFLIDPGSLRDW